jgi:hypothetical protein
MTERRFRLRLDCGYVQPDNRPDGLRVEVLEQGAWTPLVLGLESPGFLVFSYAILTCQHLYLRTNCAERGLALAHLGGEMELVTDADWTLRSLDLDFAARLAAGRPEEGEVDYIVERMRQCPVSRNIRAPADTRIRLQFL